ncbi:hypothetical protein ES703_32392 [subsurface metagenome]
MASFNIEDKVRIILGEDKGKTGIIVKRGDSTFGDSDKPIYPDKPIFAGGKPIGQESFWWVVKLDDTGEEKEYPEDKLSII